MCFTRPISQNLGICAESLFAGELLGTHQPCVSSGDGHISKDVALLGSPRFTRKRGLRGARSGELGKEPSSPDIDGS